MFCTSCGKKLMTDVAYCPYCGQRVEKTSTYSYKGSQLHKDKESVSDSGNVSSTYSYKGSQVRQDRSQQPYSNQTSTNSGAYAYSKTNTTPNSAYTANHNPGNVNGAKPKTEKPKVAKPGIFANKKTRNIVLGVIAAVVVICIIAGSVGSGNVDKAIVGTWKAEYYRFGESNEMRYDWDYHYVCTLTFRKDGTFVYHESYEMTNQVTKEERTGEKTRAGTYAIGEGLLTLNEDLSYWVMDINIMGRTMKLMSSDSDDHILSGKREEINAVEWKKQ